MKYLYCPKCADVRKVRMLKKVTCYCGASWAMFTDFENATFGGFAIPLGIPNPELFYCLTGETQTFVGWRYGRDISQEHIHLLENAAVKLEDYREFDQARLDEMRALLAEGLLELNEDGKNFIMPKRADDTQSDISLYLEGKEGEDGTNV